MPEERIFFLHNKRKDLPFLLAEFEDMFDLISHVIGRQEFVLRDLSCAYQDEDALLLQIIENVSTGQVLISCSFDGANDFNRNRELQFLRTSAVDYNSCQSLEI